MRQINKEKLSITLDIEVYEFIKDLSEKDDRSVSSMINKLIKGIMEKEQK